jgi:RND superfamily putative drug exporter
MSHRTALSTLTGWVLAHKRVVAALWLVITIAGFAAIHPASNALSKQFTVPGREGFETNAKIVQLYGSGGDVAPLVPVVTLPRGVSVDSPRVTSELGAAMAKVRAALPGSRVASYASTHDRSFVSRDGRTTFALVSFKNTELVDPGQAEARTAQAAVDGVTVAGAPVRVTGLDALRAAGKSSKPGAGVLLEVLLAGLGALAVLAFVFASFTALIPVVMALVAIPTTYLLIWPLATAIDVSVIVQFLIALIGLGIAIDYALLVVVRWREERQGGAVDNEQAIKAAMEHAGRAVVFSGTTVAVALLSLVVLPVPVLRSIGVAGLLIPLVSVAVAVTLLPVVLATVGPRLDRRQAARDRSRTSIWARWAGVVVRRRWAAAGISTAVLAALVIAGATIQLGNPRADSLAQSGPAHAGLRQLEDSGIGTGPLSPFDALVRSRDPRQAAAALSGVDGVRGVVAPAQWRRGGTSLVTVIPSADGNSPAGRATLDRIREAAKGAPGHLTVGGAAAQSADFKDAVYGSVPLVIALITGLTFLLLARAFRSLALPLKAVVLNLVSVAAALGLMVLVWQHGLGSGLWGIDATGSINVEMPIIVFAFLFGISMDYQVFIISRMREAYDRTGSTDAAVVEGVGRTGRLVTSAALIMGLAFAAMSAGPGTEAKMFATALGGGILLDATLIRGVLAPAAVALLGRWNWWLPSRPARVLRVDPSALEARAV